MIRSSGNIKMAVEALRSARWRSLLTMLGIIIGVVSVVTTVSLGEGAKRQIVDQINQAGSDLITVQPGGAVMRDESGKIRGMGLLGAPHFGTFNSGDLDAVKKSPGVGMAAPFSYVSNTAKTASTTYNQGFVIGTNEHLPALLNQKVEFGEFFSDTQANQNIAIIGKRVAEQLFGENVPLGQLLTVRGQDFAVQGVFEEFPTSPIMPNRDYNTAIFIPHKVANELTDNSTQMYQILVRPQKPDQLNKTIASIDAALYKAHDNQRDFAILKQEDNLATANSVLNLLTGFVSGIAAISLIVGGIGILNIMLVSVSERTKEIGVRKAIGATNRQILGQFLTEAAILSLVGGLLGVIASILANYLFRIFTELEPILTWQIMVIAVAVAMTVGIIFGTTPALKAASKRPIEALRHE